MADEPPPGIPTGSLAQQETRVKVVDEQTPCSATPAIQEPPSRPSLGVTPSGQLSLPDSVDVEASSAIQVGRTG